MPILGKTMYCMTIFRTMFMVCVPLFLVLTGYLMSEKNIEFTKICICKYILKLEKIISTYLIASIFIIVYRILWMKESFSIKDSIFNILGFEQYSWCIHMYIGLYLLVPVLNGIWRAVFSGGGKMEKQNILFL